MGASNVALLIGKAHKWFQVLAPLNSPIAIKEPFRIAFARPLREEFWSELSRIKNVSSDPGYEFSHPGRVVQLIRIVRKIECLIVTERSQLLRKPFRFRKFSVT